MEELLSLDCEEGIPNLCRAGVKFCHGVNCSIKGSEVFCCCINSVDCQLVVDTNCVDYVFGDLVDCFTNSPVYGAVTIGTFPLLANIF